MRLLENLKWRYATKKFDPSKNIRDKDLEKLKEAIQLSVSSYGLQLYKVLVIENQKLRTQLKKASWDQSQITDASHLFVFCNYTDRSEKYIDDYIQATAKIQGTSLDKLTVYGDFMKKSLSQKTDSEWISWSEKQTYLALSNLLTACAELKIDACPMEGFEPDKYNDILGLKEKGLNAAVIAPVGFRSEDDHTQFRKKVRKPKELLFQSL
ncbi:MULTISPECIES: NAD(P)H-dependent oxidoreductase [Maribacter]|uniref:NAD(P)H-dependent oxidoreductase n=1 Tax=Maribacter flavus TaxID=1658664 RepID=A0ABU7IGJ7_9FLAO|nr:MULTISPECIES: NAD(P)H-dependent oxidoreductase [Maribacter]MDC6404658.1 NAD(P)H-dependent oxidoreductase [Maribacter sp. PR66]MEE1972072.1 NAD(P)H-dependent oxidoreductase [Maribacter flavus]